MPLLIDCYNVLHADPRHALTTAGLCRGLGRTRWRRYGVTVVCDGLPKPDEHFEPPAGVELVHSGPGQTADDVIVSQIEASANPRRLVVVSNDHVIQAAARRRRANVWTSEELLRRLAEQHRAPVAAPDKPADPQLTDEQVRRWMRTFGFEEEDETEDDG